MLAERGIYTLANDVVYDQLVALLNSIESNIGTNLPIAIIPYDHQLTQVKQEIKRRSNVFLFEDSDSIHRWEKFAAEVWQHHPIAKQAKTRKFKWYNKTNIFRKMSAFDGPFEQFIFYDADSLAMQPLDKAFSKLTEYDFVFDDWEHAKRTPVAAFKFDLVNEQLHLNEQEARAKIHCSSFFGSKQGIFGEQELENLRVRLIQKQEIAWINDKSWWCDADLFSYMTLRCDRPLFNFTRSSNRQERTGNCADTDPFINIDQILYNYEGQKPIHRLHYMNYPAIDFARLSQGEDVNIRYKDVFLHYRFLKQPEQKPRLLKPPSRITQLSRKFEKILQRLS